MASTMVDMLARNWWALVLRGLAAIVFGMATFLSPHITVSSLVFLFGAYTLVDGIFAVTAAVAHKIRKPWWALLLEGIAGTSIGLIAFIWPGLTALTLLFLIIAWALITGFFEILMAIRMRKELNGEWFLALSGTLSILLGIALIASPLFGATAAVLWIITSYSILFGMLIIALAFKLRPIANGMKKTFAT